MGFGVKPTHEVQREAAMAVADGADQPDLVTLAGLGTASHDEIMGYMRPKNPGNIGRDLRRAVRIMANYKISHIPKWVEHDFAHASDQWGQTKVSP